MAPPVVDEIVALLILEVVEATNLIAMDINGKSDPFFQVHFAAAQVHQSQVIKKTLSPKWNETCKILIANSEKNYSLQIMIWDWDRASKNDEIGTVDLDLPNLFATKSTQDLWLPVVTKKGKEGGLVHIKATLMQQTDVEKAFWESFIRHFDTDHNSVINKTEFAAMVGSVHTELSDDQIAAMFEKCNPSDTTNGEISFEAALNVLAEDQELRTSWLAYDPMFVWHVYKSADEFNDVATLVLNKDLLPTTKSSSPKKAKVIMVHNRSTGRLEEEKIPQYIEASLRAMYSNRSGRTVVDNHQIRKLLNHLSVAQGKKYDDPRSAREIEHFIKFHHLDVDEIKDPLASFKTFNEFFFRKLKTTSRKIAEPENPKVVVSPADCRLNVFAKIDDATVIWIKGKHFNLTNLLKNPMLVDKFTNGSLVIARLAPQDYHRFHLPIDCSIGHSVPYDGALYTVNPIAINEAIDVYTENKRVCTLLESPVFGTVGYIAVGATMVGSINLTSTEGAAARKGDEHGYFAFGGSTILLLFAPGKITFDADLIVNSNKPVETLVKMGDRIGISN